jgi:hypothetical protein
MTTSRSPLRVLKQQADQIAAALKAAERGEPIAVDPGGKIAAARRRDRVKFGVVMDDKLLTIEMTWAKVSETSEVGIAEYILKYMRGSRHAVQ